MSVYTAHCALNQEPLGSRFPAARRRLRFGFPRNQQLWVPLPVPPIDDASPREGPAVQVSGRLAEGASWQDAAAELDVVSATGIVREKSPSVDLSNGAEGVESNASYL